jgi:hypothetical protein
MATSTAPGLAVALVHYGRAPGRPAMVWADRVTRQPVTAATRFQAASLSKPVTAWVCFAWSSRAASADRAPGCKPSKPSTPRLTRRRAASHTTPRGVAATKTSHHHPQCVRPRESRARHASSKEARRVPLYVKPGPASLGSCCQDLPTIKCRAALLRAALARRLRSGAAGGWTPPGSAPSPPAAHGWVCYWPGSASSGPSSTRRIRTWKVYSGPLELNGCLTHSSPGSGWPHGPPSVIRSVV